MHVTAGKEQPKEHILPIAGTAIGSRRVNCIFMSLKYDGLEYIEVP